MLEFFKSIVAFIVRIADLRGQRVAQTGIGDARRKISRLESVHVPANLFAMSRPERVRIEAMPEVMGVKGWRRLRIW
jgi:hypothetical protein